MITKEIGKITSITFGTGGYQDAMLGISIGLGSDKTGWGCGDFRGVWNFDIKPDKYSKWTEKDREKQAADVMRFISDLLTKAKTRDVYKLVGVPVEVEFESNKLKSWRILEEVL